jgi:pyruvate/2-oxoglutarate dehydrogenase complex dihydrolipoamide dehydrogenase (E3) component
LIFDAKYGELLGAHMIGANVTEMIAEIVAIRKLETTGHELIKTIHPAPNNERSNNGSGCCCLWRSDTFIM